MKDVVERLRDSLSDGPRTALTPWGNTIKEAANEIERLRNVALAASDLIENIREHGSHDNWKDTANALREVNLDGLAPVDLSGGSWRCPVCNVMLTEADTTPCKTANCPIGMKPAAVS